MDLKGLDGWVVWQFVAKVGRIINEFVSLRYFVFPDFFTFCHVQTESSKKIQHQYLRLKMLEDLLDKNTSVLQILL